MAQRKLIFWTHVEHLHGFILHAPQQFGTRNSLQPVALMEITTQDSINLAHVALGHTVQRSEQVQHRWVSKTVQNKFCLPPCRHKTSAAQMLKMLGDIGDREAGAFDQSLHASLALSNEFKQFKPVLVPNRFRHSSELGVHRPLWIT